MGDGEDRAFKARNVFLEPLHRVHVQMVRRLVEKQNIRLLQKQSGEIHPRFFAAGERRKQLLALRLRDHQAVADLIRLGVDFIPAARFKAACERVILRKDLLWRMLGHGLLQLPHARFDFIQV